jgi:hypothetical protein
MRKKSDKPCPHRGTPGNLEKSFSDGVALAIVTTPQNTERALNNIIGKATSPWDRAYWTGYWCQKQINEESNPYLG